MKPERDLHQGPKLFLVYATLRAHNTNNSQLLKVQEKYAEEQAFELIDAKYPTSKT